MYRRVTTTRRLILYDLGTNQSRVIATAKMRSDLGEPDISGRRVVYSVTGKGRSSIRIYRIDLQTTRRVLQTPIWSYSHASISGDTVVYVRQGASGAAVWRLDLASGHTQRVYRVPARHGPRPLVDGHERRVRLLHRLLEVGVAHLACLRRGNRASDVG